MYCDTIQMWKLKSFSRQKREFRSLTFPLCSTDLRLKINLDRNGDHKYRRVPERVVCVSVCNKIAKMSIRVCENWTTRYLSMLLVHLSHSPFQTYFVSLLFLCHFSNWKMFRKFRIDGNSIGSLFEWEWNELRERICLQLNGGLC